jgi:glutamine amidotransferase
MIGVVDYGVGNLRSVLNALESIEADAELVQTPAQAREKDKIVLPGVGAFGAAMERLDEQGFAEALPELVAEGRPLLGICLGMQLLADRSTEHGDHAGLGLIPGQVVRIDTDPSLRVPHVGWNECTVLRPAPLLEGLDDGATFYFVHSYVFETEDPEAVTATTDYGRPLTACVGGDGVHGAQFHPEKSQRDGLTLLRNFAAC